MPNPPANRWQFWQTMPSTMVDTTAAAPQLNRTGRRHRSAALSNANAGAAVAAAPKPKVNTVASRYLAPSSKPTSISNSAPSSATASTATADRGLLSNAATRTLPVAFQSLTYCLDTSKVRSMSPAAAAAFSPEKRRSGIAGALTRGGKVSDGGQNPHRWPASATTSPCGPDGGALAKSLKYSASNKGTAATMLAAVRSRAFDGTPRRASVDGADAYLRALSSDTDSASSGGSRDGGGADKPGIAARARPSPRSIMSSSARDAVGTRSDRFAYTAMPFSSRTSAVASPSPVKKRSLFNGLLSSPFSRPSLKQSSPIKPVASSFRRTASPSQARGSTEASGSAGKLQGRASSTDFSLDGDMKGKAPGVVKAEEEHQLRLLYTRHLQWRHANVQAAAALSSQTTAAEKYLCGTWIALLRMRKSVAIRKLQLQLLRNNCKLMAILRGQMKYLEQWSSLERVYASSLSGTTQALNATILRLPVSDGAVDIQAVKNDVGSAVDVMQAIRNSTSTQLSKSARTNVLASQLSRVAIQELVLMARCRELLSTLASLHVKYISLQGQRIQMNQRRLRRLR